MTSSLAALTSIHFKCTERLILRRLLTATRFNKTLCSSHDFHEHKHRGCHTDTASSCVQTPGEAEIVCTTAVPGLLECIQQHPAALDVEEDDGDGCQLNRHSVDLLPN